MSKSVDGLCVIQYRGDNYLGLLVQNNLDHDPFKPSKPMLIGIRPNLEGFVYIFAYGQEELDATKVAEETGQIGDITGLKIYHANGQAAVIPKVQPLYVTQIVKALGDKSIQEQ